MQGKPLPTLSPRSPAMIEVERWLLAEYTDSART